MTAPQSAPVATFERVPPAAVERSRLLATRRRAVPVVIAGRPLQASWRIAPAPSPGTAVFRYGFRAAGRSMTADIAQNDAQSLALFFSPFTAEAELAVLEQGIGAAVAGVLRAVLGAPVELMTCTRAADADAPYSWALALNGGSGVQNVVLRGTEESPGMLDAAIVAAAEDPAPWPQSLTAAICVRLPAIRVSLADLSLLRAGDVICAPYPWSVELSCVAVACEGVAVSATLRGASVTVRSGWQPYACAPQPSDLSCLLERNAMRRERASTLSDDAEQDEGFDDDEGLDDAALDSPDGDDGEQSPPQMLEALDVEIVFEAGRAALPLSRLGGLEPGYVFTLPGRAPGVVDLLVNGRRIGAAQIVDVEGTTGFRITHIAR